MSDEQFGTFYLRERDACLRVVAASRQDRVLAEDLVAEAFARAWARWATLRTHPRPAAWVVRAAARTPPTPSSSPWARRGPRGAGHPVARQRQVMALRIFLDLDTVDSATVLGIAPSTVTVHLGRALDTLRAALTPPAVTRPTTAISAPGARTTSFREDRHE